MCVLSVICDYGLNNMGDPMNWSDHIKEEMRKLIKAAREFDNNTYQPHCENPDKEKVINQIIQGL